MKTQGDLIMSMQLNLTSTAMKQTTHNSRKLEVNVEILLNVAAITSEENFTSGINR